MLFQSIVWNLKKERITEEFYGNFQMAQILVESNELNFPKSEVSP